MFYTYVRRQRGLQKECVQNILKVKNLQILSQGYNEVRLCVKISHTLINK